MIHPEDLRPGMKAIIRDDVCNGQHGIATAASYRGKVMTIREARLLGRIARSFIFEEDPYFYWNVDQVEPYFEEDCSDMIDSSSMNSLLEVL